MKIAIVIPTYLRTDKLKICLQSIVDYFDPCISIIVVANGASEETREVCSHYPVQLIWFDEPMGYPRPVNVGIRAAIADGAEYIVLLNDDAEFLSQPRNECIDVMLKPMLADETVGLTGPLKEFDPNSGYEFLIFFCVMIRAKVFESIGFLDETFEYFGEDTDYCIKAERAGWKTVRVPEEYPTYLADIDPATTTLEPWKHAHIHSGMFRIFHDAESTIMRLPDCGDRVLKASRAILQERYGAPMINIERAKVIDGWFAESELTWLATAVKSLPPNSVIVSVGEWHGRSGRGIADNLSEGSICYHVDTWAGSSGEPEMHGSAMERKGDHAFSWWWCNLHEHVLAGHTIPVRMHSENAAETLNHMGVKFDMIFIDADHSYDGIRTDIASWAPLAKEGALWCGHDYYTEGQEPFTWMGVRKCVTESFPDVQQAPNTSIWWSRSSPTVIPAVYDCFPILGKGDLDTLEKRFAALDSVVDRWVIVEGRKDLQGNTKPLYFENNLERFRPYLHKVTHFAGFDFPGDVNSPHERERWLYDNMVGGLDQCKPGDSIIIGEIGRIPDPAHLPTVPYSTVKELKPSGVRFPKRGRVFDCFIFNDELDVLEMRLAELGDVVDRFVIVEGVLTHSGNPKPLYFDENKERFAQWLPKISHIIVDDYPQVDGTVYEQAWARERWQRDSIMHGLHEAEDNDIIILGDADEIARASVVAGYKVEQGLCRLKQRLFYYYLNCENKTGWDWLKIAPFKLVRELTPCGVRYPPSTAPIIENAGWHFSFLGDAANAIKKVSDYAHREFDTTELMNIDRVTALIAEGKDIFGRDDTYEFVDIDETWPQYIRDHIDKFSSLIRLTPQQDANLSKVLERRLSDHKPWTVTAEVSTKDRYHVLPTCLTAIITQTHKPNKLVIYDDGEQADLREMSPFKGLFAMCDERGIKWEIFATPRQGQVTNHQHALDTADTDFIWRVDDDELPAPDCLGRLLNTIRDYGIGGDIDNIGAVSGLVLDPSITGEMPVFLDGSLNDVQAGLNLAWYRWNGGPREVQHLYSTFLLRVDAARKVGGYPRTLSRVGHHEESILTHLLHRAGYKVIIDPRAVTYHLREAIGGIRSPENDHSMWEHDEQVWQSYLAEWGMSTGKPTKLIVCDMGLGDHLLLKGVWEQVAKRNEGKSLTLALCFPEVFKDVPDIKVISIADAKTMVGDRYDDYSLYKYLWDKNWTGHLTDGMVEFWG